MHILCSKCGCPLVYHTCPTVAVARDNEEIERLRNLIRAHVEASNNDDSAGDTFGALREAAASFPSANPPEQPNAE